jgi:capsular polysaccharide export protein
VADRLVDRGHHVRRINTCLGDIVFWSVLTGVTWRRRRPAPPADFWRGGMAAWPEFLATYLRRHGVTDVVMLGDGRPLHAGAIPVAQRHGARVHILEHGYIRPDWLTLEPDGMSGRSLMPKDPGQLLQLAVGLPAADTRPLWRSSFLRYALWDLCYHLPNVFLGPVIHPRYRAHGPVHPLVEYAGWIWKGLKAPVERAHIRSALPPFLAGDRRFFLFPLQLPGDYQIRVYTPGGDLFDLVDAVLASFARAAPAGRHLLLKVHPLDNGLSRWHSRVRCQAAALGIADRVTVVDGGALDALIDLAEGVVLANSTVGTAAIAAGCPVIALGQAVYGVPGLVADGDLDAFWTAPGKPDADLVDAFLKVLVDRTQIRGGFVAPEAIEAGADAVCERLCEPVARLPILDAATREPIPLG